MKNDKPKVIQICVESATAQTYPALYALLDDGRIFLKANVGCESREEPWVQIQPISATK